MAAQQGQWLGTTLLVPRLSQTVVTLGALAAAGLVVAMLLLGSYTRKARVDGWLVPQHGLARVAAQQAGVVTRVHVREGAAVAAGAPLVTLSSETRTRTGAAREEAVQRTRERRRSLAETRAVIERQFEQERADLTRRIEVQQARLALSESVLARDRALRARDLIALARLQRTEQEHLDNQAALLTLEGTLRELPFRRQVQLAETDRAIAAVEQELAEAESRREVVITAPEAGTATAIQAELGSTAQPGVTLMSIVPSGAVLQAHLFAPTRAVGFLRPGQRVLLRYHAYPYQKFGSFEGRVASISLSAIAPAELGQHLAGLTGLVGGSEPLYRIVVELKDQSATAYGRPAALQPGMQLDADIMIETRRLIEWVLEPLLGLTGKWSS